MKKIASVESDTSKQSALHCVGLGFKLFVSGKGFQKWGFWFLMHTHSLFLVLNRCSSCNTCFFIGPWFLQQNEHGLCYGVFLFLILAIVSILL